MIIAKHHPNIFEFLDRLKSEHAHTNTCFEQFLAGQAPKSQSRKVKCVNARINIIVQDYENRPNLEYLRGIALDLQYSDEEQTFDCVTAVYSVMTCGKYF